MCRRKETDDQPGWEGKKGTDCNKVEKERKKTFTRKKSAADPDLKVGGFLHACVEIRGPSKLLALQSEILQEGPDTW